MNHPLPEEAKGLKAFLQELYSPDYVDRAIDKLKILVADSEPELRAFYRVHLVKWTEWKYVLDGTMTIEEYNMKYPAVNRHELLLKCSTAA